MALPIGDGQDGNAAHRVGREARRQSPVGAIDDRVRDGGEVREQEQEPSHERDGRRTVLVGGRLEDLRDISDDAKTVASCKDLDTKHKDVCRYPSVGAG